MFKIIISTTTIISFVLLIILLNVTAPVTAGPFGILAIFFFMKKKIAKIPKGPAVTGAVTFSKMINRTKLIIVVVEIIILNIVT